MASNSRRTDVSQVSGLKELESCVFPAFDVGENNRPNYLAIKSNLANTGLQSHPDVNAALCTAWGVLISCFTGLDTVCFGYNNQISENNVDPSGLPLSERQVLQLHVGGDQQVHRVFSECNPTTVSSTSITDKLNTALVLRRFKLESHATRHDDDTDSALDPNPFPEFKIIITVDPLKLTTELSWVGSFMTIDQARNINSTFEKLFSELSAASGDDTLSRLDCFSQPNLQQVLAWNSSPLSNVQKCIHHVISEQAISRPDAEAICAWDGTLSYRELSTLSDRLALSLQAAGVALESFVPICFDKSKWTVVAMLAVLKSGGIFVPLDPTHPVPRLQALAHKVGGQTLLCSRHHLEKLATVAPTLIPVDDQLFSELGDHVSGEHNDSTVSYTNGAYMIFTSGTTGEPKGALIQHGALLSSAMAHGPAMMMDHNTRSLQFAASTFDVSITEILSCLILGGCVCIPSEEARLNAIEEAITQLQANWALLTPTFVKFINPDNVPSLKTLVTGGEAMTQAIIRSWSHINLINCYGPAETSVVSHVHRGMREGKNPLNIGHQVGIHCWIVDRYNHNRLMPVGAVGELVIESHTLAREYYKEPEKTADAFILDPEWAKGLPAVPKPRRMYKTGDLVKYNHDGTFHIAGRKDTQIKFHGQRIELGEIEHHLNVSPSIKHGMIVLPQEGFCKDRLLAIVQLSDALNQDLVPKGRPYQLIEGEIEESARDKVDEAKQLLIERLPPYMIPSMWLPVEFIPRLQSGKLDRKQTAQWVNNMSEALYRQLNPDVTTRGALDDMTFASDSEKELHRIWSHVLNLKAEQLGLKQSFLSVGGDSISAMQVMSECRKVGISLTVRHIIASKSIAELASHIKDIETPMLHREVLEQAFDLSPIQKLYFSRPNFDQGHYNQSFLLRTSRRILTSELRAAIEIVIQRHSMLRARFNRDGAGSWQQRITNDVASSYRLRTFTLASRDDVDASLVESQTCLDAENGPLFAADLMDVNGDDELLFVVAHHLVIDLVSWRVILQELEEILTHPGSVSTTERPLHFQVWCKLQSDHASSLTPAQVLPVQGIPDGNAEYWGMVDEPNVYGQMTREAFEIDQSLTSLLLSKCHEALGTEVPDVLLAAMIFSFGQTFTDRPVPAIFTEGHGREVWDSSIDLSDVVGWFTTIYPVFAGSSPHTSLVDAAKAVKDGRRKVPSSGRPYFASRWLTKDGCDVFSRHWPLEITFNYLGQYQQLEREGALFTPAKDIAGEVRGATEGADVGPQTSCISLFEVSAVILKGCLRFSFVFNQNMKHQDSIRRWISTCQHKLSDMIQELSERPREATLSDFPLLDLTYNRLDVLVHEKLHVAGITALDEVEDAYPCSPMQSGLLVSTARNGAFYAAYTLHEVKNRDNSPVDVHKLAAAWSHLVQYHPILRTVFIESVSQQDSLYDQVVLRQTKAAALQSKADSEKEAKVLLGSPPQHQSDTDRPLHRFEICQTRDGRVFCRLDISHIIMDGTSMSIIFRDLSKAYDGKLRAREPPLYRNYIAYLATQPKEAGLAYWANYLSGIEPCHFPVLDDAIIAPSKELRYVRVKFDKPTELQELCDKMGVTIVNAIYAAWALTLRLYTASEEVCFGYLTSSRDLPIDGIRDVVGPVINMVACRLNIHAASNLAEVMTTVQRDYLDSLAFRHISLSEVQHALKLSNTPLFNTALSYRKLPRADENPANITFQECRPTYDPDEYNVSINIEADEKEMAVDLMYWTDTLSDGQAQNVASTFTQVLTNILRNCTTPLSQLDHLGHWHREQLGVWNQSMPAPIERSLHEIVHQQTLRRPNAPAVASWDLDLTYAELDDVSTRLALHIASLGVQPETFVLLCFDKSALAIVAMMAVLKAGGVCVPLDPAHPDAAIQLRAEDTRAPLALVSPSQAQRFKSLVGQTVALENDLLQCLSKSEDVALPHVEPSNACFVIYTSGSTGRPKGVILEHRGIATNAAYSGPLLGYEEDSRVLQFASYTFDNSLAEIFTTLTRGGCVCVPSDHERLNDLTGVINRLQVTFADITPTVACFLQPSEVPTLQTLALGGEAVTAKCVEIWRDFVRLTCCYGPSECSVNSTYSGDIATPGKATNIGRAVGCVVWVVDADDHNCLLPAGCTGELLIDGPIVSRGYLNLPEKTEQNFISPPSWSQGVFNCTDTNRRLYKTGDLVRYDSDGTLMYLGRKDNQVKLNGQRIELGEIEANIEQLLPAGTQTAVELVVLEGKKSLACFLCAEADGHVPSCEDESNILSVNERFRAQAKDLEIKLSQKLPSYMVPSMWLPVSQMPLTASGKLNRRGLRSQASEVSATLISSYKLATRSGRAPASEFEIKLAELWAKVLAIEASSIGVEDNFFKLGGDSLGAMRLVTLARKHDISLTVGSIFQKATLFQMAETARRVSMSPASVIHPFSLAPRGTSVDALKQDLSAIAMIQPEQITDVYPCTPIQEGLMALSNREPGAYVAQLVYRLPENLDADRFMRAWNATAKAEPSLRTRIVHTEANGFLQVVVDEAIHWQSIASLACLGESDRRLPQHNGAALASYALVGSDPRTPYFVWTIHHALYDGWCLPIILDKVRRCYEAPATLTQLSGPSYTRFIQYVTGLNQKETDQFWKSQLSDISTQHFPRLPSPDYQPSASSLIVHTTPLGKQGGSEFTIPTRIRAAWAMTIAAYSGAGDVVFWETMTGRDAPVVGIEDMIGATLTTVPTRIMVDLSLTVEEFLSKTQGKSAATMPHQYAGIQRIKHLNDDAAIACEAQNLIAFNHGKRGSQDSFWDEKTNEMAGTNFYTYPLMLSCHIAETDLETVVHFDVNVIPEWQMHRIMDHFGFMLESLNSSELCDGTLGKIGLLSVHDMETLRDWNRTLPARIEDTVHALIKRQGDKHGPEKLAICAWDGDLTHGVMQTLAARLASQLRELGVSPGTIVPFCLEKSFLVPVSMLAVLQCGAAFVPLDPSHPDTRINGILEDVDAGVILCSPAHRERFARLDRQPLVVSREFLEGLTRVEQHADVSVSATSTAYIIFTSGTTGKPKGTIVSHGAFCTGALAHGSAMGMDESSRVLQFASHTFDASIMEILTTLIHGGTVCVPSEDERLNDLTGAINRMGVNWTLLTPSVAQLMMPSQVPQLKTLVLGGEAMTAAHINTWASANVRLMNAYGPSETAVVATVNPEVTLASGPSNIGHAVGGLCWVVDPADHNLLVPIGATGELVVEGLIVAEGYLNNTRKTEEAFITNPTWCDQFPANDRKADRRMYKTGDLVKLAQDGTIVFQGRKDNQVKINGQRLELSEVEHHLGTDVAVQYGLAILPASGRCQKRLTAVMTLKSVADAKSNTSSNDIRLAEKATTASFLSGIRERVASHLAAYMVPSRWIVIDHFPLQSSGKLDRRRVIDWVEALDDHVYQGILDIEENAAGLDREPTDLENKLRAAWARVLNLDVLKVPFNQSFLHLGGDSISSMQLMSVCGASNIALTVANIMQSNSVVDLATRATTVQEVVFEFEKEEEDFALSPIQKVYFDCMGVESTHFNQSIIVTTSQPVSADQLSAALETLVQNHSMLRARFSMKDGVWSQRITPEVSGSFKVSSHALVLTEHLHGLTEQSQKSLDIQAGPLVAAGLFEMADSDARLLFIAAHHLVVDVVSWQIILDDLEQLLSTDRPQLVRSLPFQTWNNLQLQEAQSMSPEQVFHSIPVPPRNISYWGVEGVRNSHQDAVIEKVEIDTQHSLLLLGACHEALKTEVVDVMLASLLLSFAQTFKDRQHAPSIYNEGHGREPWNDKLDVSRTVGWFTTLCPVYLPEYLPADADIVDVVKWIKDFRRKTPGKGQPFFAHSILSDKEQGAFAQWPLEIAFNYLGQIHQGHRADSIFKTLEGGMMDAINSQTDIGGEVPRLALIEITASVTSGTLSFEFSFNRRMRRQDRIRTWIANFGETLQQAAETLCRAEPDPTMSDFPLLPLAFNGIELIKSRLSQVGVASLEDVEDAYPCSPVQEGILITQLKNPEHYAYSITFEVKNTYPGQSIDVQRLTNAWQKVVERHSTLRTVFVGSLTQDEGMHQVVLRHWPANVASYHCTDMETFQQLRSQHALGLTQNQPPHRLRICQMPGEKVICVLEMSHAICDGTSMPILFRDLALAYDENLPLTRLSVYRDYISYSQGVLREEAAAYWKQYLGGIEPCHFPTSKEAQPRSRALRSYNQKLSCASKLSDFCNESGITLSNILQLAWALVLQAYTGLDNVCFGYLVSGREIPVERIGDSIGVFINMLVFRVHLDPAAALGDIMQAVQRDLLQSMQHKEASLADMQHSIANGPLFNTAYSFQRRSVSKDMAAGSLSFDVRDAADPSEYDITVNVEVWDSDTELQLCYWSDKISDNQISNVASTFDQILTSMVSSSRDTKIGTLDITSVQCVQQIQTWNHKEPEYTDRCIHHVFEENAQTQPENTPAVDAWDATFTYQELDRISTRLAAYLVSQGVVPSTYVPLCFEKSAWTVVAMLAVLKAGGAFVPLDPAHPAERTSFLVRSIEGRFVLCSESLAPKLEHLGVPVHHVSSESISQLPDHLSRSSGHEQRAGPMDPAYIIFTSGTTGLPKGTIIEHGAFTTGGIAHAKAIQMTSTSRVLQFASHTFDASIMEILTTLLVGGCICIPNDQDRLNDLSAVIEKFKVNWTLLTPSVANVLRPGTVPSLKTLVTGGEAMSQDHITKWGSTATLVNAYGPSETSVIATTSTKVDENGNVLNLDPATIGYAVGSRCWVVDARNYHRLMPLGSIGELIVEGSIVAKGYLNNETKSRDAFIDHPTWRKNLQLSGHRHDRMYRTGDLVAYNCDGSFRYIARKDTQIKLNGQRIELGEIEHHVKVNLPASSQSTVELVVPQSTISTKALAVFFTHDGEADSRDLLLPMSPSLIPICQSLKAALAKALPSYMVPTIYIPVTKMPWTSAGKLDRQSLKSLVGSIPTQALGLYKLAGIKQASKPLTVAQQKLRNAWQKVLQMDADAINREDNFFKLGGDSVGAMKLVAAAKMEDVVLTVMNVFKHPTLSDMADFCLEPTKSITDRVPRMALLGDDQNRPALLSELAQRCGVPEARIQDVYPCSSLQEGLMTSSLQQPGAYVAENVFQLPIGVDLDRFKLAVQKTTNHVEILRSRIVFSNNSTSYQVVLEPYDIEWRIYDNVHHATGASATVPGTNGGQLALYAIACEPETSDVYFVWTVHHALYDAWSMPAILDLISQFYHNASDLEHSSERPPFVNFIKYLSDIDTCASDAYWTAKLAGASPSHFPVVSSLTTENGGQSSQFQHVVPYDMNGVKLDVTLSTVVRAAWALVLGSQTGSDDVVFGETLSGRDIALQEVGDILGPTLTTIPQRISLDSGLTVRQLLRSVHQKSIEVIPYQHAGLRNIKRLDETTAIACDFANLLVIQVEEPQQTSGDQLMALEEVQGDGQKSFFTYPLVVECYLGTHELRLTTHHNEDVLSPWQVQRISHQFGALLQQLLSEPEDSTRKLQDLDFCGQEDVKIIKEWNKPLPLSVEESIATLFRNVAAAQPHSTAIDAWDGLLSYEELNRHASNLARILVQKGVKAEVLVPCCMDKSLWSSVGMLAVILAGGAIVPLDPMHPPARHAEIVKDCEAAVVLCSPAHKSRFSNIVEQLVIVDDTLFTKMSTQSQPMNDTLRLASSRDAAFVIYTSGSTGKPKGVVIDHRSFCTSSKAYMRRMRITPASRVFHFTSYAFDIAMGETFGALIMGACLCVPSEEMRTSDLPGAMNSLRADWAFLTPSVANIQDPSQFTTLKTLVCGGEALTPETIDKWADKVELMNGYGPAECTVFCVANAHVSQERDHTQIGQYMEGGRTWVVDPMDHNHLVPVGCVGELLIDGPIVSRGYLNQEAKTAEAFVMSPAWASLFTQDDMRLYKTGDLVKYRSDGTLSFVGRKDHQVKLHGQRMELGEIEAHLETDSRIRHALVALPKFGICKGRLVAVVSLRDVVSEESSIGTMDLVQLSAPQVQRARSKVLAIQEKISGALPSYMVPTEWLVVESLPLLVSGKLDRHGVQTWLTSMDMKTYLTALSKDAEGISSRPATPEENLLRRFVALTLNLVEEDTPLDRSFIGLGGDSITAMQIMTRCRDSGLRLTLQDIIRSKSLRALAGTSHLKGDTDFRQQTEFHESLDKPFPLSPIQRLFFDNSLDKSQGDRFNQSQLLRVTETIDSQVFKTAVYTLVERHSMLRARFNKDRDENWSQIISGDVDASHRARVHHITQDSNMSLLIAQSQTSISINGPLFIADLFEKPDNDQVISLVGHHLAVDVVSWNIILSDLERLLSQSHSSLTNTKPMPFQSWNAAQIAHSEEVEAQSKPMLPFDLQPVDLSFWGMDHSLNLYGHTNEVSFVASSEAISAITSGEMQSPLGTDSLDVLISALLQSFALTFPERNLPTVFNEGHGREPWNDSLDISQTVGWFTVLNPVQISLDHPEDTVDILRRVKDTRRNVPNNGRPYFAHRYLTESGREYYQKHQPMEVIVNFLGRVHKGRQEAVSLLESYEYEKTKEEAEMISDVAPDTHRLALFEISISQQEDGVHFNFLYNKHMHHQDRIATWISKCRKALLDTADQLVIAPRTLTLSDLPLLPLNYEDLHKLDTNVLPAANLTGLEEVDDIFPCSPMQTGMLLGQVQDPGRYLFHTVLEVTNSKGIVDAQRLSSACAQVIARHPSLRTVFVNSVYRGGTFDQVILRPQAPRIEVIKCKEIQVMAKLNSRSLEKTNTGLGPRLPYQITICSTPQGRVFMKLEMNHAITDGASTALIMQDIGKAYAGTLPSSEAANYKRYIEHISKLNLDNSLSFWITYLSGASTTNFPLLNQHRALDRNLNSVAVDFSRYSQLSSLGTESGVTLPSIILAAWGLILRSYTNSEDVCFGYLASGRDAPIEGIDEIVGPLINMLVFRFQIVPGMLLKSLFHDAQEDYLASLPHQHVSLAHVNHALGRKNTQLFNTAVSIQSSGPSSSSDDEPLVCESVEAHDPSEFAVTVNVNTTRGDEGILLRYWTDVLSENDGETLASTFAALLDDFVDHCDEALSHLRLFEGTVLATQTPRTPNTVKSWSSQEKDQSPHAATTSIPTSESSFTTNPMNNSMHKKLESSSQVRALLADKLMWVWTETLGLEASAILSDSSFFELGGDSIIAMSMVANARETTLPISVADIFKHPTFSEMLDHVVANCAAEYATSSSDGETCFSKKDSVQSRAEQYEPFCLLPCDDVEAFIKETICPATRVSRASITDVLPATDFQAQSIAGHQLDSRWMLNHFYLDGDGPLDIELLRESIMNVVATFDILRTVFVQQHGCTWQVVLRHVSPEVKVHDVADIDDFTSELEAKHQATVPDVAKPVIRLTVARHTSTSRHRMFLRISHAQYDGVCFPAILDALKASYEGMPIVPSPSYAHYVHGALGRITNEHYSYWTKLLKGSKMSAVVPRERSSLKAFATRVLRRTANVQSLASLNITTATIIKAAWAVTMARITGTADIVFGHLISGRNVDNVQEIQGIVGPCLNMVPVRVEIGPSDTAMQLLLKIQNQQVENMPFESLGFRETIEKCTEWENTAGLGGFATMVQHQSMSQTRRLSIGGSEYDVGALASQQDTTDFSVVTTPLGDDRVEVCLICADDGALSEELSSTTFEILCEEIEGMARDPNRMVKV
ncbi:uncharacterized protein F5Z01DRAFT_689818 [Emericellopsis atlantica]|uniref:Carrier domain-containing protein n=1 Tax=Emericellopsis atlantica TaxID=2614577 RepID=A0A9P8CTJ8_9HYPO|nr:uncharacterized protein F5Z01DRAFT_689818 [Emericellopsis atlantica]KAG9258477.1 hypothetical protein F5Z01DRAFT_689818 [Emericellopsis atlantica]